MDAMHGSSGGMIWQELTEHDRKEWKMMKKLVLAAVATMVMAVGPALSAEHEVQMLNKGAAGAMVFEPAFVKAEPGDTIRFVPTDKSHNAETVKGMLPEGVEGFKGKINEEVVFTVDKEGVYGIKCTPHYGMGMVALIAVGDLSNAEEAQAVKHPGKAKAVFAELFEQALATQ